MSGHSKWNNIAKRKGANDAKKAKIFTKIGREMAIAIKEGGSAYRNRDRGIYRGWSVDQTVQCMTEI